MRPPSATNYCLRKPVFLRISAEELHLIYAPVLGTTMADYGRGAKAGAIAGVVLGIILAIGYYSLFILLQSTIKTALQGTTIPAGLTLDQYFIDTVNALVIFTFIGSVISGAIFGLIFAAVYNKYMTGKSLVMGALVFSVILWIIGIAIDAPTFFYGNTYVALSVLIGLIGSLAYGYLLGHFFKPTQATQPTPPSTGTM